MSFKQQTFAPVATNSTLAQAIYSYRSADNIADIVGMGYFADKEDQFNEGDWIYCYLGDGVIIAKVTADTSTVEDAFASGAACTVLTLASLFQSNQTVTFPAPNSVEATNDGVGGGAGVVSDTGSTYTSAVGIAHLEAYYDSSSGSIASTIGNAGFSDESNNLICAAAFFLGSGVLLDVNSGSPLATSQTFTPGVYKIAYDLNNATGTATYQDSNGNSGALTVMNFNSANPVRMVAAPNTTMGVGNKIKMTLNGGSLPNQFTPVNSWWCQL